MPYQIEDDYGNSLDAHFQVYDGGLIFHSRGGTRGASNARNTDYAKALRILLERLWKSDTAIEGIWVDSSRVQHLPIEERLVVTPEIFRQGPAVTFSTASQKMQTVGSRATSGGNSNRRLRIGLTGKPSARSVLDIVSANPDKRSTRSKRPRIFASSVWGLDLDRWGAWSFADKKTRDRLAEELGPADYVLPIGTMGSETPFLERGRLLALMKIGTELVETRSLVEPGFYNQIIGEVGEKWPYAFPVKAAERFAVPPLRSEILPRITEENLQRVMARQYIELTPSEVDKVLSFQRIPDFNIYSTPRSAFAARIRRKPHAGPPPSPGPRILTAKSGPAATYIMRLAGTVISSVTASITNLPDHVIFKIGFSNNPARRLAELNAYLPCEQSLHWAPERVQWHDDEINAWAMEQELFRLLADSEVNRFKGEMVAAVPAKLFELWEQSLNTAIRPSEPVEIPA